jgi:hypothetical protein
MKKEKENKIEDADLQRKKEAEVNDPRSFSKEKSEKKNTDDASSNDTGIGRELGEQMGGSNENLG